MKDYYPRQRSVAFDENARLLQAVSIADRLAQDGKPQVLVLIFPPKDDDEWTHIQDDLRRYHAGEITGFKVGDGGESHAR